MNDSPRRRKARKPGPALPAPAQSLRFLVRLAPRDVGMFRFLLEAYDNLAYFTVLEPATCLLLVVCSPHQEQAARACLDAIGSRVPLTYTLRPCFGAGFEPGGVP